MADNFDEDDDLRRLREWWQQNWLSLVLGATVGLGAIIGWQGWQSYRESQAQKASAAFAEMQLALEQGEVERAKGINERLRNEFGGTPYAPEAALAMARLHVQNEAYEEAIGALEWAVNYADQEAFRHLARVRQARLLWAQDKPEAALTRLDHEHPDAFATLYAELKGDIQADLERTRAAQESYRRALTHLPEGADPMPLQRKLDAVRVAEDESEPSSEEEKAS